MYPRKFLALIIMMCVLLAPLLSNASYSVDTPAPVTYVQDHLGDYHALALPDCHASHLGTHQADAKAAHGCCSSFVAILLAADLLQPDPNPGELIPSNSSLSLASRLEGLYRPPRNTPSSAIHI